MALKSSASSFSESVLADILEGILLRYEPASRESYRQIWGRWVAYLKGSPLKASALDANRFIDQFQRTPMTGKHVQRKGQLPSRATVKKQVVVLYTMYEKILPELHEVSRTVIVRGPRNPFTALFNDWKGIQTKPVRQAPGVPEDKVMELVEAPLGYGPLGLRDAAFLAVLFGGGLRINEAIKLNVSDVLDADGAMVLQLLSTKNGDDARQVLPDWAAEIVKKFLGEQLTQMLPVFRLDPARALFCEFTKYGTSSGRRASRSTMYRRFKHWCRMIGLPPNVSPHSARHTGITQLLNAGMSHRDVQAFSRHKSIEMVARYDSRRLEVTQHPGRALNYPGLRKKRSVKK